MKAVLFNLILGFLIPAGATVSAQRSRPKPKPIENRDKPNTPRRHQKENREKNKRKNNRKNPSRHKKKNPKKNKHENHHKKEKINRHHHHKPRGHRKHGGVYPAPRHGGGYPAPRVGHGEHININGELYQKRQDSFSLFDDYGSSFHLGFNTPTLLDWAEVGYYLCNRGRVHVSGRLMRSGA